MSSQPGLDLERYELGLLAPMGYYVGLHIRFASPLMVLASYPKSWMDHYTREAYVLRDPILAWGFSTEGTIRWSDIPVPDHANVLGQGKDYGLNYGVSVSVGEMKSRTIGSVARDDREYTDAEMARITKAIHKLHKVTEPPDSLTPAQIEALSLIAEGHRHTAAAEILGISESALKARLTAARTKLMARTTAEAIQRAKEYRLL